MKLSIKSSLLALCVACTLGQTSCNKWFDVNPKTDVKAEALFDTEHGFHSALAGIYIQMTDNNLYGHHLSYGTIDQMAQIYDWRPHNLAERDRVQIYQYDRRGGAYSIKGQLKDIWSSGYNVIANANNLLKWLDKKGESVIRHEQTRNNLRAEALALRAFMHFDLLRGWGPIYNEEPEALSIPYRKVADASKQPMLKANRIVELILEDLNEARTLLSHEAGTPLVRENESRRYRLSYHAINALLARIYCYIGDAPKAIAHAQEVIDKCGLDLQINNQQDPAQFRECLFAVNKYKLADAIRSYFAEDSERIDERYFTSFATFNELFEVTGSVTEDIRAKTSGFIRFNDQEKVISRKYLQNDEECIPLIRLPEMYYILCEMSPLSEAGKYINKVRNRRGFPTSSNVQIVSDTDRLDALYKEYRKEFYAEGQCFYFLKRNKFPSFVNSPIDNFGAKQYVFPRPDEEIEFGWTDESEEEAQNNG